MKYLFAIYDDETQRGTRSPEEGQALMEAYRAFGQEVTGAGRFIAGEGLQPTTTATTVQVRDGERVVSDGPFAETKEQLGGFYLLECDDLDDALEWAAKIPSAKLGTVEVRPVMVFDDAPREHSDATAGAAQS